MARWAGTTAQQQGCGDAEGLLGQTTVLHDAFKGTWDMRSVLVWRTWRRAEQMRGRLWGALRLRPRVALVRRRDDERKKKQVRPLRKSTWA